MFSCYIRYVFYQWNEDLDQDSFKLVKKIFNSCFVLYIDSSLKLSTWLNCGIYRACSSVRTINMAWVLLRTAPPLSPTSIHEEILFLEYRLVYHRWRESFLFQNKNVKFPWLLFIISNKNALAFLTMSSNTEWNVNLTWKSKPANQISCNVSNFSLIGWWHGHSCCEGSDEVCSRSRKIWQG